MPGESRALFLGFQEDHPLSGVPDGVVDVTSTLPLFVPQEIALELRGVSVTH
jgi:hypothetical protein